jgi:hypothetical protein
MINSVITFNINKLSYFFISAPRFRAAIFYKINFQTSPNFYNYIIIKINLMFCLGEVIGEVMGKYGEVMGKYVLLWRHLPQVSSI